MAASNARENILNRLRKARAGLPAPPPPDPLADRKWLERQPPITDPAGRFVQEQEAVGSQVRRVASWEALGDVVPPWLAELKVSSVITGTEPRLNPLRERLEAAAGLELHTYDRPIEEQREEVFSVDCGITTSHSAIADTGSVILIPSPAEPRLLSLAVPVHLVLVEAGRIFPALLDFMDSGEYQADPPSNLVLVSGASRTADIELTLAIGVHGPRELLVALIG